MNKYNRNIVIAFSLLVLSGSAFANTVRTIYQDYIPQFDNPGAATYNLSAAAGVSDSAAQVTFSINGSAPSTNANATDLSSKSTVTYSSKESTDQGEGGMGSVKVTYQSIQSGSPREQACIVYYSSSSNKKIKATITYINAPNINNGLHCTFSPNGGYKSSDSTTCNNTTCGPGNYPVSPIYLVTTH